MFLRLLFFAGCVAIGLVFGAIAYQLPNQLITIVDLLATIIAMIIGVSLAVAAILGAAPEVTSDCHMAADEVERIKSIISSDDKYIYDGQFYSLFVYFISLLLCVLFKWFFFDVTSYNEGIRWLAAFAGGLSVTLILWSLRLPLLLRNLVWQRRGF